MQDCPAPIYAIPFEPAMRRRPRADGRSFCSPTAPPASLAPLDSIRSRVARKDMRGRGRPNARWASSTSRWKYRLVPRRRDALRIGLPRPPCRSTRSFSKADRDNLPHGARRDIRQRDDARAAAARVRRRRPQRAEDVVQGRSGLLRPFRGTLLRFESAQSGPGLVLKSIPSGRLRRPFVPTKTRSRKTRGVLRALPTGADNMRVVVVMRVVWSGTLAVATVVHRGASVQPP